MQDAQVGAQITDSRETLSVMLGPYAFVELQTQIDTLHVDSYMINVADSRTASVSVDWSAERAREPR
jgi:hypothetical protein